MVKQFHQYQHKKSTTNGVRNTGFGLGQAQQCSCSWYQWILRDKITINTAPILYGKVVVYN